MEINGITAVVTGGASALGNSLQHDRAEVVGMLIGKRPLPFLSDASRRSTGVNDVSFGHGNSPL